eukprot:TRINITY_DN104465_c0_g1_i1.p1 TRINITY_DN104465_c0_g1~~TRINITY_DN104465_c0_g1_i1.p1  ORF type:complete len:304 (+),score=64.75 TRINITY_DN104465_c0_g1_i1:17-928(+)
MGAMTMDCVWPQQDIIRLLGLLQAKSLAPLVTASAALRRNLQEPLEALRRDEANPGQGALEALEHAEALRDLEALSAEVGKALEPQMGLSASLQELQTLEETLCTEMRYVYGPDWEVKPGRLVSRKGTWLKKTPRFSWELSEAPGNGNAKLYLPQGVAVPVLQIGKVVDPEVLKIHEWVSQHARVWMKPGILRTVEARIGTWFVYMPHFEEKGLTIVPSVDTWLKRSCQLSGELQPFELIYVPKGFPLQLAARPAPVEEEWEKLRHQHVHMHRKVVLASPPSTMKQDNYDILVGQGDLQLGKF